MALVEKRNGEVFKFKAYSKAILTLRSLDREIKSVFKENLMHLT